VARPGWRVIRLALRVRRADAELVLAELLELAPSGVEEVDRAGDEGIVEYAVYGAAGELPHLPDLQAAAGGALVEISTSEVPDDWSERWKRFHRPVLIEPPTVSRALPALQRSAPALHVRPPWEPPSSLQGVSEIVIDPAQAFGTGAHASTRMCLQLLVEIASGEVIRGPALDVGAGSGVLAIAAVKLGYGPVLALDNDPQSVLATLDNAAVNGVALEARRYDLRREALPLSDALTAAVVLANLLEPLLHELAAAIPSPPRHLIASGLLRGQADGVLTELSRRHGLRLRRRLELGEWAALWLSGP
jgi:ribosomal protein L11 methyltransferase